MSNQTEDELKALFKTSLDTLRRESNQIAKEQMDEWKDSQQFKKVGNLVLEIAELEAKRLVAQGEDADFIVDQIELKKLALAHMVETEKLLAAAELKEGFLKTVSAGLQVVRVVGKEAVTIAVQGALQGAASNIKL